MTKTYKNFPNDLKVSKDFSTFVPPMSKTNFDLLTENIKHDGYIRDPLVTWNDTILDGHHRYKIAEMLDLDFQVKKMDFKSDLEAKLWVANNQTGQRRLTKAQLAEFALKLVPVFSELGKQKQSQGGKLKGKGTKEDPVIATEMAAKKAGVGVNMVKDIKAIYDEDYSQPMVEMIRTEMYQWEKGGLTVKEAKYLKIKFEKRKISSLIENNELSEEAEASLNLLRYPKAKTNADKAVTKAVKALEAIKEIAEDVPEDAPAEVIEAIEDSMALAEDAVDKVSLATKEANKATDKEIKKIETEVAEDSAKIAEGCLAATKEAAKKLIVPAPSGGSGDALQDSNENSSIGDGVIKGTPNIDTMMEGDKLKRYVQATKEKIQLQFKGKVSCIPKLEDPKNFIIEIIAKIENGVASKDGEYHKDIVLIVPTNETHSIWFQKASALSNFFCDSDEHPVRLLYFGDKGMLYWKELSKQGLACLSAQAIQSLLEPGTPKAKFGIFEQVIQSLSGSGTPKAEIETLTPPARSQTAFTMPRTGKKALKKAPTAEELLKRIKTKKAAKKAPKK